MTDQTDFLRKGDKAFLSDSAEEYGSVAWSVRRNPAATYARADLRVSDCSNSVLIDFDFDLKNPEGHPYSVDSRVVKVNTLIDHLVQLRRSLIELSAAPVEDPEAKQEADEIIERTVSKEERLDNINKMYAESITQADGSIDLSRVGEIHDAKGNTEPKYKRVDFSLPHMQFRVTAGNTGGEV